MPDSDKKGETPKKKICCACPDTKVGWCCTECVPHRHHHHANLRKFEMSALVSTVRRCRSLVLYLRGHPFPPGAEAAQCQPLIEAHKQCLRAEGFNV